MAAAEAAAKAAPSILPSRPMSTTPERSEKRPASEASTKGVAMRSVASKISTSMVRNSPTASMMPPYSTATVRRTKKDSMRGLNMCSSAPENRITRPWMTTTMWRVMLGISKLSSVPPW